jgi:hypothetical protein
MAIRRQDLLSNFEVVLQTIISLEFPNVGVQWQRTYISRLASSGPLLIGVAVDVPAIVPTAPALWAVRARPATELQVKVEGPSKGGRRQSQKAASESRELNHSDI